MQVMFGWQETQEKIKIENSAISQKKTQVLIFYISKSQKAKKPMWTNLPTEKRSTETKYSIREKKEKKRERTLFFNIKKIPFKILLYGKLF